MNKLYFGDNLEILKDLRRQHPDGFIDLIYIDPPFNSKRNYNVLFESIDMKDTKAQKEAFADTWTNVSYLDMLNEIKEIDLNLYNFIHALDLVGISKSAISYLTTMAIRIWYMHKLLKPTGSFYLHCDPTMSHYLKIVCDLVFGEKNFRNEIIWSYNKWAVSEKSFSRNHDIILFYGCDKKDLIFNVLLQPRAASTLKRFGNKKIVSAIDLDGNRVPSQTKSEESEGVKMSDVWSLPIIAPSSNERLGYPTQKPQALMERIIQASSNEGDVVADFFCGCGTTIAAAEKLKRNWLGVDISHLAVKLISKRLMDAYGPEIKSTFELHGFPKDIASAHHLANEGHKGRFQFEEWIIEVMLGGVLNQAKNTTGFDGYFTFKPTENQRDAVLIEVKSGKATITQVNHFIQTVEQNKGNLGVFVCFRDQVTKGMLETAKKQGYYREDLFGRKYDKIQLLTVEDLLEHKTMNIPTSREGTFKTAARETKKEDTEQGKLF